MAPAAKTPSLSQLQAQLRKPVAKSPAKAPAAGKAVAKQPAVAKVPSNASPVKRVLPASGQEPPKKVVVVGSPGAAKAAPVAAKAPVTVAKQPAAAPVTVAKQPAVALAAKAPVAKQPTVVAKQPAAAMPTVAKQPAAALAPATVAKQPAAVATVPLATVAKQPAAAPLATVAKQPATPAMVAKQPAVALVAKQPAPTTSTVVKQPAFTTAKSGGMPAPAAPAAAAPVANGGGLIADDPKDATAKLINDALSAMSGEQSKLKHLTRLADGLAHTFQIDQINHFLRALKKNVVARAQKDGVRVLKPVVPPVNGEPRPTIASQAATPPIKQPPPVPVKQPPAAPKPSAAPLGTMAKQPAGTIAKQATPPAPAGAPVAKQAVRKAAPPPPMPSLSEDVSMEPADASPAEASPPSDGQGLPPASPTDSPTEGAGNSDTIYELLGTLGDDPVIVDGALNEARLIGILGTLWDGVARKPKDWTTVWSALQLPVELQAEALQKFLNMAFASAEPERAPVIVADLVKNLKVKMRSVEEVLTAFGPNIDGLIALNPEAWQLYSHFLISVFPKPQGSGWGWSRVGWSWNSWWQFAEKCIASLDGEKAFEVLAHILRMIQDKEDVTSFAELQVWTDGGKIEKVLAKLAEAGSCERAEVLDRLGMAGVVVEAV